MVEEGNMFISDEMLKKHTGKIKKLEGKKESQYEAAIRMGMPYLRKHLSECNPDIVEEMRLVQSNLDRGNVKEKISGNRYMKITAELDDIAREFESICNCLKRPQKQVTRRYKPLMD